MSMTYPELHDFLLSLGYKKYVVPSIDEVGAHFYARKVEDVTPVCKSNDSLQIAVTVYEQLADRHRVYLEDHRRVQVEVCAETPDGVWLKFMAYSLTYEQYRDNVHKIERSLINAWQAAATT